MAVAKEASRLPTVEEISSYYTDDTTSEIRAAALAYSQAGFAIHPVRPLHKAAAEKNWQKTYNGVQEISFLFRPGQRYNIGIKLGYQANHPEAPYLISIDLDTKNETTQTLVEHITSMFHPDRLPPMRVGQKGMGWIVRVPDDTKFKNHYNLEYQREGGQLVLPPSIHPDTRKPYRWAGPSLADYTPDTIPYLSPNRLNETKWAYDGEKEWFDFNNLIYGGKGDGGDLRQKMLSLSAKLVNRGWSQEEIVERFSIALAWSKRKWSREALNDWGDDDNDFFYQLRRAVEDAQRDSEYDPDAEGKKAMPARVLANRWLASRGGDEKIRTDPAQNVRHYSKGVWEKIPPEQLVRDIMRIDAEHVDGQTADRVAATITKMLFPINQHPDIVRVALENIVMRLDASGIKTEQFSPDHGILWRIQADFNNHAECPIYESFISRTFDQTKQFSDEDERTPEEREEDTLAAIETYERFIAYTMMNTAKYHKMLVIQGPPRSGKSTALEIFEFFHHKDEIARVQMTDMGDPRFRHEVVSAAVNISSETRSGNYEASADDFIKAVVAGDPITVRPLYANPVRVEPVVKLVFAGNHMFRTNDTSGAMEERMLFVSCPNALPAEERDPDLRDKLREEIPGILNRILMAGQRLIQEKKFPTMHSKRFIEREIRRTDNTQVWVDTMCEPDDKGTPNEELYSHYREWTQSMGFKPVSLTEWNKRMSDKGVNTFQKWAAGRNHRYRALRIFGGAVGRKF